MALSSKRVRLLAALIGAAATIGAASAAAALTNPGNTSNMNQNGAVNNVCSGSSQCTQGG